MNFVIVSPESFYFKDIKTLAIGTADRKYKGSAISAYSGSVYMEDIGDLYMNTTDSAIFMQESSQSNPDVAVIDIRATGNAYIHANSSGIWMMYAAPGKQHNPAINISARTLDIEGNAGYGVFIQDWDQSTPSETNEFINLSGEEGVRIASIQANALDIIDRAGSHGGERAISVSSKTGPVVISAGKNGLSIGRTNDIVSTQSYNVVKTISINGPIVEVSAQGQAVSAMKNGRVSIAGDQITLTGSTTAVQLQDQGYLDLSSRSESSTALVQINGNVEAASGGTVSLKNADVNLSAGSKFNVETLSGDNSSIMVNKLLDEGSTVAVASNQSRNLRIRASSDINDKIGRASCRERV